MEMAADDCDFKMQLKALEKPSTWNLIIVSNVCSQDQKWTFQVVSFSHLSATEQHYCCDGRVHYPWWSTRRKSKRNSVQTIISLLVLCLISIGRCLYCLCFSGTHRVVGSHGSDGMTSQSSNSKQMRRGLSYRLRTRRTRSGWTRR